MLSTLRKKATVLKAKTLPLPKKKKVAKAVEFDPRIVELDIKFLEERRAKGLLGAQFKLDNSYNSFNIASMNTGCGLLQLSGNTFLGALKEDVFKDAEKAFQKIKDTYDGYGAIICTLGKNYFANEKNLLKLGFRQIAEYINPGHGEDYTQRLYIYITKKGQFEGNKDISA